MIRCLFVGVALMGWTDRPSSISLPFFPTSFCSLRAFFVPSSTEHFETHPRPHIVDRSRGHGRQRTLSPQSGPGEGGFFRSPGPVQVINYWILLSIFTLYPSLPSGEKKSGVGKNGKWAGGGRGEDGEASTRGLFMRRRRWEMNLVLT